MQVISRLKRKMVFTVLVVQAVVFAVILISLNVSVTRLGRRQTFDHMHSFLKLTSGAIRMRENLSEDRYLSFPMPRPLDSGQKKMHEGALKDIVGSVFFSGDVRRENSKTVFSLQVNTVLNLSSVLALYPLRYTEEEMTTLATVATKAQYSNKPKYIYTDIGSFLYLKQATADGFVITFADWTEELKTSVYLLFISIFVYILALLVSAVMAHFVAERSVRPVKDAFETQKRFIADAGHELKTPVTVIGANADALSGEIGENKWLDYIKTETERMDSLVSDLLYLAKNDSGRLFTEKKLFDLSKATAAAVLPFESIIFEQGKKLSLFVSEGIMYTGDRRRISQIIVILLDNAIKNSPPGADIRVTLDCEPKKRSYSLFSSKVMLPFITVYNQGEGLDSEDMKKVFQRFYRTDTSRARETGGSGLGLSIAQSIAESHNGIITVAGEKGSWVSFTLHLGVVKKKN
ncbi:MAG: HAMP domain-containing histidine kinase [Spirochaetaceae bacterium]|nr:HAMP domain-containing histidine kinase [Spirochaetaceae bacterium]